MVSTSTGIDGQQEEDADDEDHDGLMSDSERNLAKGLNRRTWTGPPLLETVSGHKGGAMDMSSLKVGPWGARGEEDRQSRQRDAASPPPTPTLHDHVLFLHLSIWP